MRLYLLKDGQQIGPIEEEAARAGLLAGEYSETTAALIEGESEWKTLGAILQPKEPPPLPPQVSPVPATAQPVMELPVQVDALAFWGNLLPWLALIGTATLFLGGFVYVSGVISVVAIVMAGTSGNIRRWWIYAVFGIFPVIGVVSLILLHLKVEGILRDHGRKVPFLMDKVPRPAVYGIIGLLCLVGWDLRVFGMCSNVWTGITGPSTSVEQRIANNCQSLLTRDKQAVFDQLHPIGTAKSIVVHEVNVDSWKHGKATNQESDIIRFTVRYTLFWEGPITTDGYTKIESTYDMESQRWTTKVLGTNGTTNEDVKSGAISFGVEFLKGLLQ